MVNNRNKGLDKLGVLNSNLLLLFLSFQLMALTFFEPKENPGNGDLPFLNEFLEQNPKNKTQQFLVKEIVRVKSGKGYLVITEDFSCFLWKNQALSKMLMEALEHWVNNPDSGYCLYVFLKDPKKQDFTMASDKEQPTTWFASKNGYTTMGEDASLVEENQNGGNPFM